MASFVAFITEVYLLTHFIFRPHKTVWQGANSINSNSLDSNCEGWHVSSSDKVGLGSSLLGNKLLDQEMYSCQQKNIVLCIEVLTHVADTRKKRDALDSDSLFIESSFHKYLEDVME